MQRPNLSLTRSYFITPLREIKEDRQDVFYTGFLHNGTCREREEVGYEDRSFDQWGRRAWDERGGKGSGEDGLLPGLGGHGGMGRVQGAIGG